MSVFEEMTEEKMADKKYESIPKTRQFSHSKYENKYASIYEVNVRKDKSRVPK